MGYKLQSVVCMQDIAQFDTIAGDELRLTRRNDSGSATLAVPFSSPSTLNGTQLLLPYADLPAHCMASTHHELPAARGITQMEGGREIR